MQTHPQCKHFFGIAKGSKERSFARHELDVDFPCPKAGGCGLERRGHGQSDAAVGGPIIEEPFAFEAGESV